MTSIAQRDSSPGSWPTFPFPNSHYNRPSVHWPCVNFRLVGGRDKYGDFLLAEWSVCTTLWEALDWDTSVGRVDRYTNLVGCVLVPVSISRGVPWPASSGLKKPSFQALLLIGGVKVYHLAPEVPFLRRVPTRPEAFLEPPEQSGLQSCARTHQSRSCDTLVRSVGRTTNTGSLSQQSNLTVFGRTPLPAVLILLFCVYVLFIEYPCSTYFLFFCIFFLTPNRPQHLHLLPSFCFLLPLPPPPTSFSSLALSF